MLGLKKLNVDQIWSLTAMLLFIFSLDAGVAISKIGFACRVVASWKGWQNVHLDQTSAGLCWICPYPSHLAAPFLFERVSASF